MLPIIPKPAISARQKAAALAVTGFVDLLQIIVFPAFGEGFLSPLQDALDFVTALVLIAICGFKWQFVVAFMLELVPLADLLPTWTAVALMLRTHDAGVSEGPTAEQARIRVTRREPVDTEAIVVPPVQAPPAHR